MSADNWTYCPKCDKTARDEKGEAINKLLTAYGKCS